MDNKIRIGLTKYIVALVIFGAAAVAIHAFLLGGVNKAEITSADPLMGQVSQALATSKDNPSLLQPKSDFTLSSVKYFEDKAWVVADIVPVNSGFNQSTIIMKKNGDLFVPVRGPSSAFTPNEIQGLPDDVSSYVTSKGLIYVPVLD